MELNLYNNLGVLFPIFYAPFSIVSPLVDCLSYRWNKFWDLEGLLKALSLWVFQLIMKNQTT